jgi:hypothetical protein
MRHAHTTTLHKEFGEMKGFLAGVPILAGLLIIPVVARAHCDAVDGPVATAAVKALDSGNVYLVFPFVPAKAEPEIKAAFKNAAVVRRLGPKAKALADRYFMETAVRLHRAGEGAPYTGLRPAGTDFGPVIPAAEEALSSGELRPVLDLLSRTLAEAASKRFSLARKLQAATKQPSRANQVPNARERVSAELAFIGYVESVHLAITAGEHTKGSSVNTNPAHCE